MIELIIGLAVAWQVRGEIGWEGTLISGCLIAAYLHPTIGYPALLVIPLLMAGEPQGWKPKFYKEGDIKKTAAYGSMILGIGAILVPLAVWMRKKYEPSLSYKWWPHHWEWDAVYFGALLGVFIVVLESML